MSVGNVETQFASGLRLFMATRMLPKAATHPGHHRPKSEQKERTLSFLVLACALPDSRKVSLNLNHYFIPFR
jgi:hypothetical protein